MKILAYLLASAVSWPMAALAQAAPPSGKEPTATNGPRRPYRQRPPAPEPPIESRSERPLPDYDGRGEEPTDAGDVLIWIPRVVFFPLYVVTEFLIRRPLGALATTAEENEWPPSLRGGPKSKHGFVPSGLVDYGLRSSVGLYVWADDPFFDRHQFRLRAVTGGLGYFNVAFKERILLGTRDQVGIRGEWDLRSDWVFHGTGPRSGSDPVRYGAQQFDGKIGYEARLWRRSAFAASAGIRDVRFEGDVDGDGDPNIEQAVASGRLAAPPPGFGGYTIGITSLRAAFDTRRRRLADPLPPASDFVSPPATGLRVSAHAEHALRTQGDHWLSWGGALAGFVDPGHDQRVVGLTLSVDFVDPLAGDEVPFTDLASLGGARPLRGFLAGRLLGRSATALELTYEYPIWVWLDGAAHYAVGNVFGPELEGFELELLKSSFGLGFRGTGSRDHAFELLVAFGTGSFEEGAEIESFRLLLGATTGF